MCASILAAALSVTGMGQASDARGGEALTLPMAVEIALRTHPLLRATASGREVAEAQLQGARAGRFPALQFSETLLRGNNPVFVFGSLLEQARFGQQNFDPRFLNNPDSLTNYRTSFTFRMPVLDQRQTSVKVAQAGYRRGQAEKRSEQVEQQIRFEVLRSFYGVLLAQAEKEVADEAVRLAEADVKRSRDRTEAGLAVVADLLSAEVQLADFRQQQIRAEGEIAAALAGLNISMGLSIDAPQRLSGELAGRAFAVAEREVLVRQAVSNRPDLASAELALRERARQVEGARAEFLPRVDVFANYGLSGRNLWSGSGDYLVGASLTFNLFDAGRKARIDEARAAERMAENQQQHQTNQVRLEVVRAYQQYITARERLAVGERVISHATEALRIVQDRYNEGLTTITEVLRAETALFRARANVLAARYDYYVGYANVLLATGSLTDVRPFVS
ncbi:MAG: TolC family protein [Blastocatellia bacterium]